MPRQILGDLQADALIGAGDQGNLGVVAHGWIPG